MYDETFWTQMPVGVRRDLIQCGYERAFRSNEAFLCRGDKAEKVLILRLGWARVVAYPSPGTSLVVHAACEGELCGDYEALNSDRYEYDYVAGGGGATVLSVPLRAFSGMCHKYPDILMAILKTTANRLQRSERLRATNDIRTRTAIILKMLCVRFGIDLNDLQTEIRLAGFTRDDLAALADTSARSLDRAISYLYAQGILLEARGVFVVDRRALWHFVGEEGPF
ncbi:Crp/Fnr family transcriptional regulator [Actinomadura nitritigenes]|uniref:Crp/Fnr family transcriptional regulator n=1 Tax=Actinomadura nitritigenes TaxID=134602 RepID=UPI003D8BF938